MWINAPVSLSSAIGTFATGWLATKALQEAPGCNRVGAGHRFGAVGPLLYLLPSRRRVCYLLQSPV